MNTFTIKLNELHLLADGAISAEAHAIIDNQFQTLQKLIYLSSDSSKRSKTLGYIASEGKLELRSYSDNLQLLDESERGEVIFNDLKNLLENVDDYGELQTKGQTEKATELNKEKNGVPRKAWEVLRKLKSTIPLSLSNESAADTIAITHKPKIRHLPKEKGELIYLEDCFIENINYYERDIISFVYFDEGTRKKIKVEITEAQLRLLSQYAFNRQNVNIEINGSLRTTKEYRGVLESIVASENNDTFEEESLALFADLGDEDK